MDDHDFFRSTLVRYLKGLQGLEIVGEAKNGREALEISKKVSPHLVIMDVMMPEMDGIDACRAIKELNPEIKVVLFSMYKIEKSMNGGNNNAEICITKERLFRELPSIIEELGRMQ